MKAYFAMAVEAVGQKPQHSLTQTWLSRQSSWHRWRIPSKEVKAVERKGKRTALYPI